jgi:hypothetical protein
MSTENRRREPPKGRPFPKGVSGNPGGRPRKLVEIEAMLDAEFRTVESVREAMTVLRKLAVQGIRKDVYFRGDVVGQQDEYNAAFMALYLDRVLGPVKEPVSASDLSELSDETLSELREKLPKLRLVG